MRTNSTILEYRASPIPFQNSLKRSAEGTFYYSLLERKPPLTLITSLVFSCMFLIGITSEVKRKNLLSSPAISFL